MQAVRDRSLDAGGRRPQAPRILGGERRPSEPVRAQQDGRDPLPEQGRTVVAAVEQRRLDVRVRIDEPGRDDPTAELHHLPGVECCLAEVADRRDPTVPDGDVGVGRGRVVASVDDPAAAQDEVEPGLVRRHRSMMPRRWCEG